MNATATAFEFKKVIQRAPKPKGWRLGEEHSFSTLWILFPDETTHTKWSMDWRGAFSGVRNQQLGIERFKALLLTPKYRGHKLAIIYDHATNTKLLIYNQGIKTGGIL